ncbi:MAG: UDP-N-acetylglucosamine 1-carboxyvinyltransferase [Desulfohalobiaceae bacterium]
MDKLIIQGGKQLQGKIRISGSKNGALPIMLACMLNSEPVLLQGVPELKDIQTTMRLLRLLGCEVEKQQHGLRILAGDDLHAEAPYDLVRTMRASVLCLGPLLSRLGEARVALPGGCAIGSRPIDIHLKGLEQMGAHFDLESGYVQGSCRRLQGAHITLDFPTVGGTENLLMAAVLAKGETVLENAAREPEIQDLAHFLNACGANIQGQGSSVIRVQGVDSLHQASYQVLPDRIEAGTYLAAAGITGSSLELENFPVQYLESVCAKLQEMGLEISAESSWARVAYAGPLQGVEVVTQPYPGFPTDMQAQIMALMCVCQGSGLIQETIFENRFMHALELMRLGARIKLFGDSAFIRGGQELVGAPVMASDLRASASLVLAGLAAQGTTEIRRVYHLDRGYERMEEKLAAVGADIQRVQEK